MQSGFCGQRGRFPGAAERDWGRGGGKHPPPAAARHALGEHGDRARLGTPFPGPAAGHGKGGTVSGPGLGVEMGRPAVSRTVGFSFLEEVVSVGYLVLSLHAAFWDRRGYMHCHTWQHVVTMNMLCRPSLSFSADPQVIPCSSAAVSSFMYVHAFAHSNFSPIPCKARSPLAEAELKEEEYQGTNSVVPGDGGSAEPPSPDLC